MINQPFFRRSFVILIFFPLLCWLQNDLPNQTFLKNFSSVLTILCFFQMGGMFVWSRANRYAAKGIQMSQVIKIHKLIGYTCTAALLFHPILLVLPKFFEAGTSPGDALTTILTTFNLGIVLGLVSWGLLLTITITALARKHLPMKYKTWRTLHGILATCFIFTSAWHVIDLGRNSSMGMSFFIIMLAAGSILLFSAHLILNIYKEIEI